MRSLLYGLGLFVSVAGIAAQTSNMDKPPFTITISTAQPTVKLGGPIMIHFVLKSISQKQFSLPSARNVGTAELNYRIAVASSDGAPVPETEIGRKLKNREATGSRSVLIKQMNLGDQEEEDSDLNNVVKITNPGDYEVRAERSDPLYFDSHIKSNKLVIHVIP